MDKNCEIHREQLRENNPGYVIKQKYEIDGGLKGQL